MLKGHKDKHHSGLGIILPKPWPLGAALVLCRGLQDSSLTVHVLSGCSGTFPILSQKQEAARWQSWGSLVAQESSSAFPGTGPTPLCPLHAGTAVTSQQSVWGCSSAIPCALKAVFPSAYTLSVFGSCSGASAGGQGVTSGLPHPYTAFHCAPSSQARHECVLCKAVWFHLLPLPSSLGCPTLQHSHHKFWDTEGM